MTLSSLRAAKLSCGLSEREKEASPPLSADSPPAFRRWPCRSIPASFLPRNLTAMLPPVGALALVRSWHTSPGGRYPVGTVILFSMSNEKTDCTATCTGRDFVLPVFLIAYVASIVFGVEWPSMF